MHIAPVHRNDRIDASGDGVVSVSKPPGESKEDPNFGTVEVYHDRVQVDVAAGNARALKVRWQGCADAGLCYPPEEKTVRLTGLVEGRQIMPATRRTSLGIVFSDPDICSVGMPFDEMDPKSTVVGTAEGSSNGRSRILHAESSLPRIYARRDDGLLLGASLLAVHGEHLAHQLAWAVQRGEAVQSLLELPYYHPTVEEMMQSALKDAARQMHSPTSSSLL